MKIEKISMIPDTDVTLTTYLANSFIGKPRPAMIICPGGAYLETSEREAECIAVKYVTEGFQAFVLDYSTKKSNPENARFPNQIIELGNAIKLVRDNASLWGVDKEKIFLIGFSAGGNLIANYGNYWNSDLFQHVQNREILKPTAMILSYSLLDYLLPKETKEDGTAVDMLAITGKKGNEKNLTVLREKSNLSFFGTVNPREEDLKKASPIYNINLDTPPAFIWTTVGDDMLDFRQSIDYMRKLNDFQIPSELHVFQNGPHGLSLANEETAIHDFQIDKQASNWVKLSINWMNQFL